MAQADYSIHIFKGNNAIYYEDDVEEDFIYLEPTLATAEETVAETTDTP